MSEKFCLKWNDYQVNWTKSLSELRNDREFEDVTLISDDKVKFSAHKILLSSCSSVFKFILKGNPHLNPLLYLSGVSSFNLGHIMDYIYHGEVNLFQDQLDSFLESAQKLEVEGLLGGHEDNETKDESTIDINNDNFHQDQAEDKQIVNMEKSITERRQQPRAPRHVTDISTTKFDVSSITSEEIVKKKEELIEKRDGILMCLACEYTCTHKGQMKRHVETHLEGLSYSCTLCNKEFR